MGNGGQQLCRIIGDDGCHTPRKQLLGACNIINRIANKRYTRIDDLGRTHRCQGRMVDMNGRCAKAVIFCFPILWQSFKQPTTWNFGCMLAHLGDGNVIKA